MMGGSSSVPRPDARELKACGLAALGEAGVIALPAHLILTESSDIRIGIWAFVLPFIVAFVGGSLLVCWFRSSPNAPVAAGVAAALLGLRFGWGGDLNRLVFVVVVSLLVTLRIVTLALRDWRTPYHAEFGWMSVALGLEVLVATGPQTGWKPALVLVAPLFFVGSLASRATTVWTAGSAGELDEHVRAGWVRRALLVTGGLVAAMAAAVALGIRGGLFDRLGAVLAPLGDAFASLFAWGLSQIARAVFWFVDLFGIDPDKVREFFERLQRSVGQIQRQTQQPGSDALWQRLLGLVAFALVAFALVRLIRRFRPQVGDPEQPSRIPATVTSSELAADAAPGSRWTFRRELPADRVRRWYAQSLLELERLRVPKDPALTPAEFAPEVARAFPLCAQGFDSLTHAYEDVRYGNLTLDRRQVQELEDRARSVLDILKRTKLPPEEPPGDTTEAPTGGS